MDKFIYDVAAALMSGRHIWETLRCTDGSAIYVSGQRSSEGKYCGVSRPALPTDGLRPEVRNGSFTPQLLIAFSHTAAGT